MAYKFVKDASTYVRWTNFNQWANLFGGSQSFVFSAWFRVASADAGTNLNRIISWCIASGGTGFTLGVDSDGSVYAGARSISTDSFQKVTSNRKVSIGGSEWNHVRVVVQYGTGGSIQLFLNGEYDNALEGIAFGSSTLSQTAQTTDYDFLGNSIGTSTAPTATTGKFAGDIAEIAAFGTRGGVSTNTNFNAKEAKREWLKKGSTEYRPDSLLGYPYFRMLMGINVAGGLAGRVSTVDSFATPVVAGNISGATLHPPVRPGTHWRYRNRKSLILPAGSSGIAGVTSATLGDATLSATATLQIQGQAAQTLDALTSSATGTLAIAGTVSATLGAVTSAATGALAIQGTLTKTLDDATLAATGSLQATGSGAVAATLADATLSAAGALAIAGTTSATLAAVTSSATGALQIKGTTSATLEDATLAAAGTAQTVTIGTLTATLADVTLSSSSKLAIAAQVGATLGDVTLVATGDLQEQAGGTVNATLADLSASATGALAIKGTTTVTLADVTSAAAGALALRATLTATLANATLVGRIVPTADIEPDTNSAWWTYSVPADDLTYAVAADPLTYEIGV